MVAAAQVPMATQHSGEKQRKAAVIGARGVWRIAPTAGHLKGD